MKTPSTVRRGTKRDRAVWDQLVNQRFGTEQPILSPEESVRAAKRLYRFAMGKPFPGKIELVSGNRYTWVRYGVMSVNPDRRESACRGLRALIHNLSHYCHARLHPKDAPHSIRQARLEGRMAGYAVKYGFLDGKLKSKAKPKEKVDVVQSRYEAIVRRRRKWERTITKATKLRAKAAREQREYKRRHGARLQAIA